VRAVGRVEVGAADGPHAAHAAEQHLVGAVRRQVRPPRRAVFVLGDVGALAAWVVHIAAVVRAGGRDDLRYRWSGNEGLWCVGASGIAGLARCW